MQEANSTGHSVAVIGGATAGAEVAARLAEAGVHVAVFEQNPRPYGKIEDGLPRWHLALRRKEYETIGNKLSHPNIDFVPLTKIGRDIPFEAVTRDWGFSAVVLACGAWRDRSLPVEGADAFEGNGLIYQNPFIIWFNHYPEADYSGPTFEPVDGALVVGGGLASIDVAKVLMLETTRAKLAERGIDVPILELEVKGIPKILKGHDLEFDDLGLTGCTIFYRRRIEDMPLVEAPENASPERLEKVAKARGKLLEKAMDKYRFTIEPLCMPDAVLVEDDRMVGLRFRRTAMKDGRPVPTDESFEARGPYAISSIGSVPEPMPGIPMKGELLAFADWDLGRLDDYPSVFSAGNVVTGKGNIVASRKHGTHVVRAVARFLGVAGESHEGEEALLGGDESQASGTAQAVGEYLNGQIPLDAAALAEIRDRVRARQASVDYRGDYKEWIARVSPGDSD